jgi:antitoxin YefM
LNFVRYYVRLTVYMKTLSITEARKNIYKLVDQANEIHEPIQITGKRNNAVLVSEEDWRAIQETLHLLSIPGMRKSIIKGIKTPLTETTDELKW